MSVCICANDKKYLKKVSVQPSSFMLDAFLMTGEIEPLDLEKNQLGVRVGVGGYVRIFCLRIKDRRNFSIGL